MKKILTLLLIVLLVGCSSSWSMTSDDEQMLKKALQDVVNGDELSLSITIQEDLKSKNNDNSEMILQTNYIAYRIHNLVSELQYQADQSIAHVVDFERTDKVTLDVINNKEFTRLGKEPLSVTLDDDITMDDLKVYGVERLTLNESMHYDDVTVKTNGDDLIYYINVDADTYEPLIDLKDFFVLDNNRNHDISEYMLR